MRLVLAAILVSLSAFAQFQDLATTDDGAQLYFSSAARLRSSGEVANRKLFVLDASGPHLVAQRDKGEPYGWTFTNFYDLFAPEPSADGSILAFTAYRSCGGGSGCLQVEDYEANIVGLANPPQWTASGHITMSRNGRFAVLYGTTAWYPAPGTDWVDLRAGEKVRLPKDLDFPGGTSVHRRIASDGTVITSNGGNLGLWRKAGIQSLRNSAGAAQAMIDDAATRVVYESWDGTTAKLIAYDIATGNETLLTTAPQQIAFSISGDASAVLFVAPAQGAAQAFLSANGGVKQLTQEPEGIAEATISGNGQVVWAATTSGRILRVLAATGTVEEKIVRTPNVVSVDGGVAPGSLIRLTGTGLSDKTALAAPPLPAELAGVQVNFGSVPAPLQYVSPTDVRWQVSWDAKDGPTPFELISGDSPFVSGPDTLTVSRTQPVFYGTLDVSNGYVFYPVAVHSDWSGLVTPASPAHGGEIVNLYMSGLGAVSPSVPLGVPAPANPPARIVAPLECTFFDGGPNPAEILYAGLAPGMFGIYQVSLRVPVGLRMNPVIIDCGTGNAGADAVGSMYVQPLP
jgi:uncharacterized protein (TIGR03437 family)